ncbi:MAG: hypothetical protein Ct9H90mP13_06350 [Pseudomonadota bacterium]|nr:MAG: hypothetical protein Ct9H90mP13_06350 [Pseudomonadota bacterium]
MLSRLCILPEKVEHAIFAVSDEDEGVVDAALEAA